MTNNLTIFFDCTQARPREQNAFNSDLRILLQKRLAAERRPFKMLQTLIKMPPVQFRLSVYISPSVQTGDKTQTRYIYMTVSKRK